MNARHDIVCHLKPYIQPFERVLALKELAALAQASPVPEIEGEIEPLTYRVRTPCSPDYLVDHLTYWERIYPNGNPLTHHLTGQVRREATTTLVRNGITPEQLSAHLPFQGDVPLPGRRHLRYGAHGIHEYRGKFFPQLVRSLLNIAGTNEDALILDPMCGSGTTPTEAILGGCQALGLDLNPLSVLISQAKSEILTVAPEQLAAAYRSLKTDLLSPATNKAAGWPWFEQLPAKDRDYLARWFAPDVLADLDPITVRVEQTADPACRKLFKVALSNILRRVSWQKVDDLRVRKEVRTDAEIEVQTEFLTELNRSVRMVLAFLYENQASNQTFTIGQAKIIEGDARQAEQLLAEQSGTIDTIITSPPYATALPYLDTDRLSLSYLGLLPRRAQRPRDYEMIGNREVTERQRRNHWQVYQQRRHLLPTEISEVIDTIDRLNRQTDVGFRRRNLPALLGRYFLDMRQVLQTFTKLLKPGAPAYVVVGNNHTIAGGQRIDIETDKFLAQLGQTVGLTLEETISMEMLVSRDIFKKNTGNAETIICFRN